MHIQAPAICIVIRLNPADHQNSRLRRIASEPVELDADPLNDRLEVRVKERMEAVQAGENA